MKDSLIAKPWNTPLRLFGEKNVYIAKYKCDLHVSVIGKVAGIKIYQNQHEKGKPQSFQKGQQEIYIF
jgi:hypothetical protein